MVEIMSYYVGTAGIERQANKCYSFWTSEPTEVVMDSCTVVSRFGQKSQLKDECQCNVCKSQ